MAIDLLPIPDRGDVQIPDDKQKVQEWLKDYVKSVEDRMAIMRQNTNTLSDLSFRSRAEGQQIGHGLVVNQLTGRPQIMLGNSITDGLEVTPGTDAGKVNVRFNYLSVDGVVMGTNRPKSITGKITLTAGSATLAGTGTKFLTELGIGDCITETVLPESHVVTAVASDTSLTIEANATGTTTGTAAWTRNGLSTIPPMNLIADLNVAGKNGLDTGAEAASKWYAVYVICSDDGIDVVDNSNNPPVKRKGYPVATLLSLSATAPKLPPGFNRFRRVGWVYNNAASGIEKFRRAGNWIYWWGQDRTAAPFVVTTTSTTATTVTALAPPTSRGIILTVGYPAPMPNPGTIFIGTGDATAINRAHYHDYVGETLANHTEDSVSQVIINLDGLQRFAWSTRAGTPWTGSIIYYEAYMDPLTLGVM